jgi:hypothetical protein
LPFVTMQARSFMGIPQLAQSAGLSFFMAEFLLIRNFIFKLGTADPAGRAVTGFKKYSGKRLLILSNT